jgi:tetratricopeptide (TPR) repeat protein
MSVLPPGDPGAGERDAKAVHADQMQGTQVGDHGTQDNRFTQVISGRDALVAGRDFYVQDLHVHIGDADGEVTGELRPDGAGGAVNDVTADIVVRARTIHGGIHRHRHIVASGGRPRYRLGPAGPEPHGPLGELPVSQLLAARNGVVGFTGRDEELAALRSWRDAATADRAALLVHGPGGQGKTRLVTQFAAEARRARWRVAAAQYTGDSSGCSPGDGSSDDRSSDGPGAGQADGVTDAAGLLVLVDYAERWPAEDLLSLADDPVVAGGGPVRLLLVARSASWWASVRHEFTERGFRSGHLRLGPLAADVTDRGGLFDEARDRFAAVLGVSGADQVPRPANLGEEAFGLVLAVHMAALAAVDAHARGQQAPADPVAVSAYLLDREFAYWQRLCSAGRVRTRPMTMSRTVFTATLTRPLPYRQAVDVLERVGVPSAGEPADTVLADHGCCYPPTDPDSVLEPLYPDRLAEDFLALLLPGHDVAGYQPDAWASEVPSRLLAGPGNTAASSNSGVTRTALTMLVEAARRWPHLVRRQLVPLLRAHPELALAAGSAVLSALAELPDLDLDVLAAIESLFPLHRLTDLDPGIADVTARLTGHQLLTERGPAVRAVRYAHLADRLDAAGRHEEALTAIAEAVRIRRALAALGLDVVRSDLARSLLTMATQLTQLGRHEDALAAIEESLGIYQNLAEHQPGTYRDNVARALDHHGNCLSRLGRHTEALAAAQDAVRIRRQLADADPAADPADLGRALHNLAVQLSMVNRREDALAADEEALPIRRMLAATNPQEFLPELALSLSNISGSRYRLGQLEQALDAGREAVALYRDLAAANPSAFRFALTRALHNLGSVLSDLGHHAEGLALSREAVHIRRELAAENPAAFTADLARSLDGLAADLMDLGQHDEAVLVAREAVEILRPLASQNPVALRHDLARAQSRLSVALSRAGRAGPALDAAENAVTEYHVLAAADPAMFWPEFADALNVLGNRLSALNRPADALPHQKKAVRIGRILARDGATESRRRLAGMLSNLATSLIFVNSSAEALAAMRESLRLCRTLAGENPGRFGPELARVLSDMGVFLDRFQLWEEARDAAAEAVMLYRALAETDPATYTPHLARSLKNLGVWLAMLGRQDDARTSLTEAVHLYGQLAAHRSDRFRDRLAESLRLLSAASSYRP